MTLPDWDSPEAIVEGSIKAQKLILTGYGGNPETDRRKYEEALTPRHVAISLTGEPTLYKDLGDLIRRFQKRGLTTFLVSNGTLPSALAELEPEPTQLYISVCAPDAETYKSVCRPQVPRAWEKLNETLALLPSFQCPTVMRITCVRGLNMKNAERYGIIIKKSEPNVCRSKSLCARWFFKTSIGF
jgi:tRNA wybutosine-synthesizing protein 1